ncbi:MAG: sigma-54 dependent transcriptional regulator [Nitrospirota bacterium]
MAEKFRILIIEDKKSMAEMLAKTFEAEGYLALTAGTGEEGVAKVLREGADLVLTDLKLPGMSGLQVLKALKEKKPLLPVIMMTAFGSIETAVKAVKAGAYDFLTKPFDISHMLALVEKALESGKMAAENLVLREEFAQELSFPMLVGKSKPLIDALELLKKAAPTRATVLITGESGTGKELFAKALHHLSPRKDNPFVAVNCAAIPKDLLESELFGHEKGSFTGADARRMGKFELADKGTLFLDEVGEMDPTLQAKLLRALQGEMIERVGGSEPFSVDVRVVAASNRVLSKAVAEGKFREDLYYRLNVFPVHIPPLRERREDIPLLARHFLKIYETELKKGRLHFSDEAIDALSNMEWKGNVRELENCIERAVILADGDEIGLEHLGRTPRVEEETSGGLQRTASLAARAAEIEAIKGVLRSCGGNKSRASEVLGVSYKTLLTKIKDYGIG